MKNNVRALRERAGLTQVELARRAKLAGPNLSAIERGKLEAWPRARRALARALKVPEAELFPGLGEGGAP